MEFRIDRFVGLKQSDDELLTERIYAADACNVSTEGGQLAPARRPIQCDAAPLAGGIGTLAAFFQRVGGVTDRRLVAINERGIYELSGGAWHERHAQGGSARASTLNYQHNGEDVLLIADGERPVLKWDGGERMEALAGCDRAFSHLALHYERIWGSGIKGEPDAVYWSRAFDPEDWSGDLDNPDAGGGVVLIPTWNGGSVRSIRTLFNDVLVFKDQDLYRIVGTYPGNYEVVRVHGIVGPVAPGSIAWAADACYFLGKTGLCAYNGVTVAPVGGGDVRRVFARITKEAAHDAVSAIYRDKLYLAMPIDGATHNNAVLEVDLARGAYLLHSGMDVACFLPLEDELLMADRSGQLFSCGAGEAGVAGDAHWRMPWQEMAKGGRARLLAIHMFASGSMDLTVTTDEARVTRRVRLGGRMRPACVPLSLCGRRFTLEIRNVDGGLFAVAPGLTVAIEEDD